MRAERLVRTIIYHLAIGGPPYPNGSLLMDCHLPFGEPGGKYFWPIPYWGWVVSKLKEEQNPKSTRVLLDTILCQKGPKMAIIDTFRVKIPNFALRAKP